MKKPRQPKFYVNEEALQEYSADVIRTFGLPDILSWHTPNGGYRHPAVANQMKRAGVKRGVPDWTFLISGPGIPGMLTYEVKFLELKYGNKGRLSDEQISFRDWCEKNGVEWRLARTIDQIDNALREMGIINKPAVTQPAEKPVCVVQDGGGRTGCSRSSSKRRAA